MSDLLAADEPAPVLVERRGGRSAFVIIVDHASRRIPQRLHDLGLPASELTRHTAWDIGALGVAREVAALLDALLVWQGYSRLVIDCNRRLGDTSSIPTTVESIAIPGNIGLHEEEVTARQREIFQPYHDQLRALIDERLQAKRPTILIAQHSMTDVLTGVRREMHCAVVSNRDRRFADLLLNRLRSDANLIVADNEPYSGTGGAGYTMRSLGEALGLPHVQVEIRQDLIQSAEGQVSWARRMADALRCAEEAFVRAYGWSC